MKVLNYDDILKGIRKYAIKRDYEVCIHKVNERSFSPKVSIILLDWECRERFHSLDWLNKQDVSRELYELIWIELYNRVVPEVMEKLIV